MIKSNFLTFTLILLSTTFAIAIDTQARHPYLRNVAPKPSKDFVLSNIVAKSTFINPTASKKTLTTGFSCTLPSLSPLPTSTPANLQSTTR